ncbi:hypothetical protein SFUMM280S_07441 [Streptomyces fumanus]
MPQRRAGRSGWWRTDSANRPGSSASGTAARVALRSTARMRRRSSGASSVIAPSLSSGRSATARSSPVSRSVSSSAEARVNRSALKTRTPAMPSGSPSARRSNRSKARSTLGRVVLSGSSREVRPGRSAAGAPSSAVNCTSTWNSGCRASDRAGFSSSTRNSNGTSWRA